MYGLVPLVSVGQKEDVLMPTKPSYEELEQRIMELEKGILAEPVRSSSAMDQSKVNYEVLFQEAAEGILVADVETKEFRLANPAICEMLGYTQEELVRLGILDIHPKEALEYVLSKFQELVEGRINFVSSLPCLRNDGTTIYADIKGSVILIDGTKCNVGFFTDVTERRGTERDLREIKELDEKMLYGSPVAFVLHDRDLRILRMSRAYKDVTGYDPDEVLGKRLQDFMPEGRPKLKVIEALKKVRDEGVQVGPRDILAPTKEEKYLSETILPVFDSTGRVSNILSVLDDITERKQAEEALRESEKRFQAVAEGVPVPAMISRRSDGVILWANEHFTQLLGLDLSQLIGRRTIDFFYDLTDRQVMRDMLRKRGYVDRYEFRAKKADGTPFWLVNSSEELIFNGEEAYFSGFYDVTERKCSEEALQESHDTLEQRVKQRTSQLRAANERLERVNTGLQVFIEHRQEEIKRLQEDIVHNANKLIMPYIDKMDKRRMGARNTACLEVITSNLKEIVSPFVNTLSQKYVSLSPTEIQVADLVRQGKTSKEIASLFNVSANAITVHRYNIRRKLDLLNKKVNLRSYLQSLPQ
jgi:PAS domain S-box-containing protein